MNTIELATLLLGACLPGAVGLMARGIAHAKRSAVFWGHRLRHGGHPHTAWRTRVYDFAHYRSGLSRDVAFRYSTRCEWTTAARAGVHLAAAVVLLGFPFWVAPKLTG